MHKLNTPWTIADDEQMQQMIAQGVSYKEMSRVLRRPASAISRRRAVTGFITPRMQRRMNGVVNNNPELPDSSKQENI